MSEGRERGMWDSNGEVWGLCACPALCPFTLWPLLSVFIYPQNLSSHDPISRVFKA